MFGSNLAGIHGAGAAKQAREQFGAQMGVGEGETGQCYAFPTLGHRLQRIGIPFMVQAKERLYAVCRKNPGKEYLLTKVGCGLAGYPEEHMKRCCSEIHP